MERTKLPCKEGYSHRFGTGSEGCIHCGKTLTEIDGLPEPKFYENGKEDIMLKMTDVEIDSLFMQYLDKALCEFEQPHEYNDESRLNIYRDAFHKVINVKLHDFNKEIAGTDIPEDEYNRDLLAAILLIETFAKSQYSNSSGYTEFMDYLKIFKHKIDHKMITPDPDKDGSSDEMANITSILLNWRSDTLEHGMINDGQLIELRKRLMDSDLSFLRNSGELYANNEENTL